MNTIFYPAVFHPEETGYSVTVPNIEGCFTQGETMNEAIDMTKDAIALMLEGESTFPNPSLASAIKLHRGDFIAMIPFEFKTEDEG